MPPIAAWTLSAHACNPDDTPDYALDYDLFHEAIHLQYFDHGPQFTEALARFEDSELASAYLDGYEAAERSLLAPVELEKI